MASTRTPPTKKATVKKATAKKRTPSASRLPEQPEGHFVKRIASGDAPLVKRLREICLALPEADERRSHGEPTWFAGKGKVFAMLDNHHHGAAHLSVWLPQPFGAQEALMQADPERFFRPPYVGAKGWVGVVLDTKPDWDLVARLVRESFVHVAAKKLLAELGEPSRAEGRAHSALVAAAWLTKRYR